jgi:DNA invertase Pin-like site-specific DNA recombinase
VQIVTTLHTWGVAFRSLTDQLDTTTPHGAFLCSVFGALAPYERTLPQERLKAGLAATKRRSAGPLGSSAPRVRCARTSRCRACPAVRGEGVAELWLCFPA